MDEAIDIYVDSLNNNNENNTEIQNPANIYLFKHLLVLDVVLVFLLLTLKIFHTFF